MSISKNLIASVIGGLVFACLALIQDVSLLSDPQWPTELVEYFIAGVVAGLVGSLIGTWVFSFVSHRQEGNRDSVIRQIIITVGSFLIALLLGAILGAFLGLRIGVTAGFVGFCICAWTFSLKQKEGRINVSSRVSSALASCVIALIVGIIVSALVANFIFYPLVYGSKYPGDAQASVIAFFGGLLTAIFAIIFGSGFVSSERPPIES